MTDDITKKIQVATLADPTKAYTKAEAFDGVVVSLIALRQYDYNLRIFVAAYVKAGGTIKELHLALKALDDPRCIKSEKALYNIASRARVVGILGTSSKDNRSSRSLAREQTVENPAALNRSLPSQRDVEAYAVAKPETQAFIQTLAQHHEVQFPAKVVNLMDQDGFAVPERVSEMTTNEVTDMITHLAQTAEYERGNAVSYLATSELLLKQYGTHTSTGEWRPHSPMRIIKTLIPELTNDQRDELINLLSGQAIIDV